MDNQSWMFESKSSPGVVYTTQFRAGDGQISCNCQGWTRLRGTVRECTHTKRVEKLLEAQGATFVTLGQTRHAVQGGVTSAVQAPSRPLAAFDAEAAVAEAMRLTEGPLSRPRSEGHRYYVPMTAAKIPDGKRLADFGADEWAMEQKFDGVRITCRVHDGNVTAWARPRVGAEHGIVRVLHPRIVAALLDLPNGYYDGELVTPGGRSTDVVALENSARLVLVLFDVIESLGEPLVQSAYARRRAALELIGQVLDADGPVAIATSMAPSDEVLAQIIAAGGEGVMLKRLNAPYLPGQRSDAWLKVKQKGEDVFEVIGFEAGKSGPYSVLKLERVGDRKAARAKTLNNDWLRRCASGNIRIGTLVEVEFQVEMAKGFRHPMVKRIVGEE